MVPLNLISGGFSLHLTKSVSQVGITAIETERTQIHFLSDILFAVVFLDVKVSNVS